MAGTLLLNVQEAEISFGRKTLFENLSFNISEGDKICLIGKNGVGKSTLMNVITGHKDLDGGLRWQLQGSTVGYLQQEAHFKKGQKVYDFIFEEMNEESQAENHAYKIERIVEPLDLHVEAEMSSLSGGQLRRAALARALVEQPDILLLDEPTNHLDLDVIEWLETYLKAYRGAVVCISHDRAFLSAISDRVFWLDRGRLRVCPKGFGFFEEWSTMLLEQEERELHNRQKLLDQEVEWASRGVKARRKRNVRRVDLMKSERDKLRSDKNALNQMLARIEFTPTAVDPATSRSVCEFHKVSKSFAAPGSPADTGKVILDKMNLRILRGDRIGIVGRNGSGKTTFLKLLVGELKPDEGTVKRAKTIEFAYFDQKRKDLMPESSLQYNLCPNGGDYIEVMGKTRHVCGYLKDFLFDPRMASQPVNTLSGGQKNRLMLAKVLANPGNLLILDEPTNDLDMDTLDMLEEVLANYDGTLIVVSHDRDFLDQTVSKILAFEGNGKIEGVIGGYQDYLNHKKRGKGEDDDDGSDSAKPKQAKKKTPEPAPTPKNQRMPYKQQFELSRLPDVISGLEREIGSLEQLLADPDLYAKDPKQFQRVSQRMAEAAQELSKAEYRWLELEEIRLSYEG